MTNSHGYTFLELTVVLFILSFFFLIAVPVIQEKADRQQTHLFLDELSADLYLASNLARSKQTYVYLDIFESPPLYLIRVASQKVKRVLVPVGYKIDSNYQPDRISFYSDGQVSRAGTIVITDRKGKEHKLVIQLSSGRFYISQN